MQYNQNGYYNQPYQPYANPPGYPQPPQSYSYQAMNIQGNVSTNPQHAVNVRWNEPMNAGNAYKRP